MLNNSKKMHSEAGNVPYVYYIPGHNGDTILMDFLMLLLYKILVDIWYAAFLSACAFS